MCLFPEACHRVCFSRAHAYASAGLLNGPRVSSPPPLESVHLSRSKEPNRVAQRKLRGGNCSTLASGVADCISFDWSTVRVLSRALPPTTPLTASTVFTIVRVRACCHCHSRRDTYARGALQLCLDACTSEKSPRGRESPSHCPRNIHRFDSGHCRWETTLFLLLFLCLEFRALLTSLLFSLASLSFSH